MLKVIVIGDQHFKVDNIEEVDLFIAKVEEIILNIKPDFVVLLGDLLDTHERIHSVPLNKAYKFINNIRNICKTFVIVGNHDMEHNGVYLESKHWLNALKEWDNVKIVDKVIYEFIDDKKFIFLPYVYVGRFEEALNTLDTNWKDAKCIFAHQEFYGCKMGAFNSIDGDKWELDFPNIISGHIHLNQKPQKNIYYPGSSLSIAFGETTKNIIAKLEFNDDTEYILNEIDLELPKKKIIYINSEEVDNFDIPKTEDKIKLSISGEYEEFKTFKKTKKYKELTSKGIKIIFKPKKKEVKTKKENIQKTIESNPNDFNIILKDIIDREKNSYLFEAYQLVVNSKEINPDDIFFL